MSARRGNAPSQTPQCPRTITPKFALSVVVQWPPRATLRDRMVHKKWEEIKFRAFSASPKNVHGLRDGTILCYWENPRGEHAFCIRAFLDKDTTRERMKELNVISITCHESCKVRLSPRPFQSEILDRGTATVYDFRVPYDPSVFKTPLGSSISSLFDLSSTQIGIERIIHSDANAGQSSVGYLLRNDSQDCGTPEVVDLQQSQDKQDKHSANGDGDGFRLPRPFAPLSAPRKRPFVLFEAEDANTSAKRPKEEASTPETRCGSLFASNRRGEDAPPLPGLLCNVLAVSEEKEGELSMKHQRDKNRAESNFGRDHSQAESQLTRREEITSAFDDRGRISELVKANEDSKRMRLELDRAELSEKVLKESLRVAEENCRRLEQRERELQVSLQRVVQELEETRKHGSNVEHKLHGEKTAAELAWRKAEEEREDAIAKRIESEREAASERIRRIAAESVLLDVRQVFGGDGVPLTMARHPS